ncbi:MAG: squalene synthase HpnC [Gammaproteobacteria bacterium]|nr:squalene synthase HpnC [Gammaproteobacteria bacterium]
MPIPALAAAYQQCLTTASLHYENFPVASRLLPRHLRRATAVVYCLARRADDIVDEGNADSITRHRQLQILWNELDAIAQQKPSEDGLFLALADVVKHFNLPLQPFYDLLTAFRLDIDNQRYANEQELLNYCRHSANPIGRIVLHLHRQANPSTFALSDNICTALQLINFIQDIDSDIQLRQRCYIPEDEMHVYGIQYNDLVQRRDNPALQRLIGVQLRRARQLLTQGAALTAQLHGRLAWELRAIVASGWCLLNKLEIRRRSFIRPTLRLRDAGAILRLMLFYNNKIVRYQSAITQA